MEKAGDTLVCAGTRILHTGIQVRMLKCQMFESARTVHNTPSNIAH